MNALQTLCSRNRFTVGLALLLSFAGLLAWAQIPKEEDPKLKPRFGLIVAPYPGADAEQVERLVVEPLEDELSEIEEINKVKVTVRSGLAVFNLEMRMTVSDTQAVWDDVDDAIDTAYAVMPPSVIKPTINDEINVTESVVVAIHGSNDVLKLADTADELRNKLLRMRDVSRVDITGDPSDQITIALDPSISKKIGLSPEQLSAALSSRNVSAPGGSIRVESRKIELRPNAEFRSLEEIRRTPIQLRSGATVPLSSIATVKRSPLEPPSQKARIDGNVAVFVGAVPASGIDAVSFGEQVQSTISTFEKNNPDVTISTLAYQPDKVDARLSELIGSLVVGIFIVLFVLLLAMGFRLGFVVASVVPLVTFAAIAVYAATGGIFHQMAAAALVLALGLLVDNAIVMTELVQAKLDEGKTREDAVAMSIRELAIPLLSSTATTLAAFIPMLLAPGTTGEFTRAIPVVAMITLSVSYVYAMVVTPLLAGLVLRPNTSEKESRLDIFAGKLGRFAVKRPVVALVVAFGLVGASGSLATQVKQNFFPSSDREQMVVDLEMPDGTHLDATDDATRRLERFLETQSEVVSVSSFVGRSAPKFYYNLPTIPNVSSLAQVIVTTKGSASVGQVMTAVREFSRKELQDAVVVPRRLEQGPPIAAPVEVRLAGDDLQALYETSQQVQRLLRDANGAVDVRSNHGPGTPILQYEIDDAEAARRGVSRQAVVTTVYGRTTGLPAGDYRGSEDPIPIRIRSERGEFSTANEVSRFEMTGRQNQQIPISRITQSSFNFGPAVIHRYQGERVVSVFSEVESGSTYAAIVQEITPKLQELELPNGVRWEYGGAVESSGDANKALGKNAPLAAILLLAILLAQFNSVRRTFIVLMTAPLAMLGIWPGLLIADLPFGFVALLGAIALIGIVVNGAIVLIDVIDSSLKAGATVEHSIVEAVQKRTRPILLTALTTIAGLTPLLFSDSTLWPPMAAAMISGLTVATLLTLVAVPAMYRLLFRDPKTGGAA